MGYGHGILSNFSTEEDTVIDLMSGHGDAVQYLNTRKITCVDIYEPYLLHSKKRYHGRKYNFVLQDSVDYLKTLPDKSVDVIQCIDGIEHLTKERGLELLQESERVAKKYVVIFTPDGYTENHPHDAWGIEGGDIHQKHLSGWTKEYMESRGYTCEDYTEWPNAYDGTSYHSILMVKKCSQ